MGESVIERVSRRGLLPQLHKIARSRGLHAEELLSSSRERAIVAARDEFVFWMHETMGWGYQAIGRMLGREPTGIRAAVMKLKQQATTTE